MDDFLKDAVLEVSKNRTEVIDKLVKFSLIDLIYFWGQGRDIIIKEQEMMLPLIAWAKAEMAFEVPKGEQQTGYWMKHFLEKLSDKELVAFSIAAVETKSILASMAFSLRRISASETVKVAFAVDDDTVERLNALEIFLSKS